jgi:hypothetical protein
VRVVEDGASAETGVALADLFGTAFAQAANGQAGNLPPGPHTDPFVAYQQAAAKSGPLGSLIARLGARTATDDAAIVDLLGEFGRRRAIRSQLLNDARATPRPPEATTNPTSAPGRAPCRWCSWARAARHATSMAPS